MARVTAALMPIEQAPIYPGPRPSLEKLWPQRISPAKHLDPHVIPDCAHDPEKWFPTDPHRMIALEAQAACERCPLRQGCARVALDDIGGTHGIWAGVYLSPKATPSRRAAVAQLKAIAA